MIRDSEQGSLRLANGHMTKTALAAQALRAAILGGELNQDEPLTVGRIARQLGMSQTPVREALRTLQAEGLLNHEPHHSVSAARYSTKDIHDIFQLRATLESAAMRAAAPRLSDGDLEHLATITAMMHGACARGDIEELNRLNAEWHLFIYGAADNRVLLDLVQHLWKKFMFEVNWILPGHSERSCAQHDAMLAALCAHDVEQAANLMAAHICAGEEAATRQPNPPAPFPRREGGEV